MSVYKLDIEKAVSFYWHTRSSQANKQASNGKFDQGSRSAVTGGAQMNGFISLFRETILRAGIPDDSIFDKQNLEIPGFFRPTKNWDLLVVHKNELLVAIKAKSQAGPSFGNNFNNRSEEALGTALDLWTAFREQAYHSSQAPFVGYFFMLEDCDRSREAVVVREHHFPVREEFIDASYMKRYEILCRKLVLERQYTATAFITSDSTTGIEGKYSTPAPDVSAERFLKQLSSHIRASI
jgi:hypothetical protein